MGRHPVAKQLPGAEPDHPLGSVKPLWVGQDRWFSHKLTDVLAVRGGLAPTSLLLFQGTRAAAAELRLVDRHSRSSRSSPS